jgi:phage baseplate assembly protein gpV
MNAVEVIRQIAGDEVKKQHLLELGLVTSIFPHSSSGDRDNYEVNVKLKNRNLELRKVPVATQMIGFSYIPHVGDLVLLAYIRGDINGPVILGRLYNDEDRPPESRAGEMVYISQDPPDAGLRRLFMKFPSGITLTITDDLVKTEAGNTILTMNRDGDVTINSGANVTLTADGDIDLKAQNIRINCSQSFSASAGTSATVEASANLDLKGSMVRIN